MNRSGLYFSKRQSNDLDHWIKLLKSWIGLTERYCEFANGEDMPFIYNERANVGLLAAAAWQCGWSALEEFSQEKNANSKRGINTFSGRGDLYILRNKKHSRKDGKSSDNTEYVEAKQVWLKLDANQDDQKKLIKETIPQFIKGARDDARLIEDPDCNTRIGVVFVTVSSDNAKPCGLSEIKKKIEEIKRINKVDLVSWCFPAICGSERDEDDKRYYKGVILIASQV